MRKNGWTFFMLCIEHMRLIHIQESNSIATTIAKNQPKPFGESEAYVCVSNSTFRQDHGHSRPNMRKFLQFGSGRGRGTTTQDPPSVTYRGWQAALHDWRCLTSPICRTRSRSTRLHRMMTLEQLDQFYERLIAQQNFALSHQYLTWIINMRIPPFSFTCINPIA